MPRMEYDFVTSRNFGVVQPVSVSVLALTSPIDVWLPEAVDLTEVSGRVSEWRGRRNGRILGQSNVARQPRLENGLIRMSSDAQSTEAQLDLAGTQLGSRTEFTFACHGRIHPEQLGIDNQYFFGSSTAGAFFRVAYRFTNGTRYIRLQFLDNVTALDVPLPTEWNGRVGIVITFVGGVLTMYLTTGGLNSRSVSGGSLSIQTMSVGNAIATAAGGFRGYIGGFGIWSRTMTQAERDLLLSWVA